MSACHAAAEHIDGTFLLHPSGQGKASQPTGVQTGVPPSPTSWEPTGCGFPRKPCWHCQRSVGVQGDGDTMKATTSQGQESHKRYPLDRPFAEQGVPGRGQAVVPRRKTGQEDVLSWHQGAGTEPEAQCSGSAGPRGWFPSQSRRAEQAQRWATASPQSLKSEGMEFDPHRYSCSRTS